MKFPDAVVIRIRNEADRAGFSDNAALLALDSLTEEDLLAALIDAGVLEVNEPQSARVSVQVHCPDCCDNMTCTGCPLAVDEHCGRKERTLG